MQYSLSKRFIHLFAYPNRNTEMRHSGRVICFALMIALALCMLFDAFFNARTGSNVMNTHQIVGFLFCCAYSTRLWGWFSLILLSEYTFFILLQPLFQPWLFVDYFILYCFSLLAARITQVALIKQHVFRLQFTHLFIIGGLVFTVVQLSLDLLLLSQHQQVIWSLWSYHLTGHLLSLFILLNTFMLWLMHSHNRVYMFPEMGNVVYRQLLLVACILLLILVYAIDLIRYASMFLVIPILWFCYRHRWWGLCGFALTFNAITLFYIVFKLAQFTPYTNFSTFDNVIDVTLAYQSELNTYLFSSAGFTVREVLWFLLCINILTLYVSAMIFELDEVQKTIRDGQLVVARNNETVASVNEQIQLLNKQLFTSQEQQKQMLSQTMIDQLQTKLTVLQNSLTELEVQAQVPQSKRSTFTQLRNYSHMIYVSIYEIVNRLKPMIIEEKGLIGALESDDLEKKLAIQNIQYTFTHVGMNRFLNDSRSIVLYRIIQEAANNAIKYSQATQFHVLMHVTIEQLYLEITDNGIGFERTNIDEGFGLSGMYNRTVSLGGIFDMQSDNGTKITIQVPFEKPM